MVLRPNSILHNWTLCPTLSFEATGKRLHDIPAEDCGSNNFGVEVQVPDRGRGGRRAGHRGQGSRRRKFSLECRVPGGLSDFWQESAGNRPG